jgi:xylulose-5-phosphate/fructose-6-phosphate phosphoketolase
MAAAWWLRQSHPQLTVRVVNVVDLFRLQSPQDHPHGMTEAQFTAMFGREIPVVFAFHGYPSVIHELLHHRPNPTRFHVRGYVEEGTTTTSFDMTALNGMSRYDLAIEALRQAGRLDETGVFEAKLRAHRAYIREHDEDSPEVQGWRWTAPSATVVPRQAVAVGF